MIKGLQEIISTYIDPSRKQREAESTKIILLEIFRTWQLDGRPRFSCSWAVGDNLTRGHVELSPAFFIRHSKVSSSSWDVVFSMEQFQRMKQVTKNVLTRFFIHLITFHAFTASINPHSPLRRMAHPSTKVN